MGCPAILNMRIPAPFCEEFVDYMVKRGEEIQASIGLGDNEDYLPLKDDATRNIYGFFTVS